MSSLTENNIDAPKVSVIIPVYNVEKYLRKCIDSVINQTLRDIEIICVDDGSTDGCPEILDGYAEKDSRIKVIHKENGGYGKAMNIGIDAAKGEYIGIVESDDFILSEMYETLYNTAVENKLDVVKSDHYLYWSIADSSLNSHKKNNEKYYNKILKGADKKYLMMFSVTNWNGIYRRKFLVNNGIHHHESPGASFQDIGFWFQIMAMAENIMIIDKAFYMYRQDNLSASVKSKQKMLCTSDECEWVRETFKTQNVSDEWSRYCFAHQFYNHMVTFKRIDDSFKLEYLQIAKDDYIKNADRSEKPADGLYDEEYKWLKKVSENPEDVYNNYISEKNRIFEILSSAKEFVIYGTGIRAARLFFGLNNNGYYDNVRCFVISDTPSTDSFFGKPVKSINEVENKEALIIIAVKKNTNAYKEIKEKLDSLNFNNVYDSEILSNYF